AAEQVVAAKEIYVVTGIGAEQVEAELGDRYTYVRQEEQLGTGHAVMMAKEYLKERTGETLILAGDTPLIGGETLKNLLAMHLKAQAAVTILTAVVDDPFGYGRIIRDKDGLVKKIVEQKDAD